MHRCFPKYPYTTGSHYATILANLLDNGITANAIIANRSLLLTGKVEIVI